ncbi:MAG: hypothetical protein IPO01_13830 [Chitinophagaceae bacterium]|nr:hypothetical protein [Chitinophagaceae bacterium]
MNDRVTLSLDLNYRITSTDYLDDVSYKGYPNKTLLDVRNPATARFTWRGNEVGGETYPKTCRCRVAILIKRIAFIQHS